MDTVPIKPREPRPLTRSDTEALCDTIRRWVEMIDRGEMEAGPIFVSELAGALVALEVVLGKRPSSPLRLPSSHGHRDTDPAHTRSRIGTTGPVSDADLR